jgi:hypothetical protein
MALAVGAAVMPASLALAADHLDGSATGVKADPSTDINDVYSWVSTDGSKIILAMTVFPGASTTSNAKFSNAAYYVFHTTSRAAFTDPQSANVDVICSFDTTQKISCWVGGNTTFVNGDASVPAGISSADGKVKVFAGLRKDHFFFNLDGFNAVRTFVTANAAGITFTNACAQLGTGAGSTQAKIVQQLGKAPAVAPAVFPGTLAPTDFFKTFDALAIVVEVDKTLLNASGKYLTVSAATVKTQ